MLRLEGKCANFLLGNLDDSSKAATFKAVYPLLEHENISVVLQASSCLIFSTSVGVMDVGQQKVTGDRWMSSD